MNASNEQPREDSGAGYPASWNEETLLHNWIDYLTALVRDCGTILPIKRIRYQVERSTDYLDIVRRWPRMSDLEKANAWKKLIVSGEKVVRDILPACVQCGDCCRKGSPTLQAEDLEILRQEKIPWDRLITLRRGEPVQSSIAGKPFILEEERIKIREKTGSAECTFLDAETEKCTIYADRPLQCRAQACWDPAEAKQLADQAFLARQELFGEIELLRELIDEHDRRCSFRKLTEAFESLQKSNGESIGEVLSLLAYEDHFRHFLGEKLNIPAQNLDLVFGRSFSALVPLFGFRVVQEGDGSHCLVQDEP